MGKKAKPVIALAEDFKAMISMVPKLVAFLKVYDEITTAYQKYRKNGGAAIPGIEKHLGSKKPDNALPEKSKETKVKTEAKAAKEMPEVKKSKKKG